MKTIKFTAFAITLVVINQIFVLTPVLGVNLYYLLVGVAFVIGLSQDIRFKINPLMIWFLSAAILSIIVNDIPDFFKAPLRLTTFLLVVALVGPLLFAKGLNNLKRVIFKSVNTIVLVLSICSIFLYLLGVSLGRNTGGFAGFFNHSMIMGPLAGISLILCIYRYYYIKNPVLKIRKITIKRWLLAIALIVLFLVLLLSSSRAALVATLSGIMFFFYKIYQRRITGFIAVLFVLSLSFIITFPLWSDFTEGIAKKQVAIQESGDLLTARRDYWEARLGEFESNPLIGIGFATVSVDDNRSDFNIKTGEIEPGTSWLAILSMVGVLGFIPIVSIFTKNMIFLIHTRKQTLKSALLGALLVFFITHMFAEGYFLSSGGFLFFYVWLLLGIIDIYRKTGKILIV